MRILKVENVLEDMTRPYCVVQTHTDTQYKGVSVWDMGTHYRECIGCSVEGRSTLFLCLGNACFPDSEE